MYYDRVVNLWSSYRSVYRIYLKAKFNSLGPRRIVNVGKRATGNNGYVKLVEAWGDQALCADCFLRDDISSD